MSQELLACPFCGGEAKYHNGYPPYDACHFIDCAQCDVSTPILSTKVDVATAWNKRAQPAGEAVAFWKRMVSALAGMLQDAAPIVGKEPGEESAEEIGRMLKQRAAASPAALTIEQVELFAADLCKRGELNWAGFRHDENGLYTIPVISPSVYKLIRALLAAPPPAAELERPTQAPEKS